MALLSRDQIKTPVLPKETVHVPGLGGDVVVRGLLLSESLAVRELVRQLRKPLDGETEAQAQARAGAQMCAATLAKAVCLANGEPVWPAHEWEVFGAQHTGDALMLFEVSQRLDGLKAEDVEKN